MTLLRLIQRYKQFDFAGFMPIWAVDADGQKLRIGMTKDDVGHQLARLGGDVFDLRADGLHLNPSLKDYAARTEAVDALLLEASEQGILPPKTDYSHMGGDDWYSVGNRQNPLFEMRRFYSPYMGIRRYASRVNAFHGDQMWIVKRGTGVHEYPGRLDNLIGAGQVVGRTIFEHMVVEAHEEAGLSAEDCTHAVCASMIHTCRHTSQGFLFDENIYIYDLDTQGTIMPHIVNEWEVQAIEQWPFDRVLKSIRTSEEFRPEAALCLIDFFIRKGFITPDNEPDYDELCFGLRSTLPKALS